MGVAAEARLMEEPMDEVRVDLGPRAYSVLVGVGLLDGLGARLAGLGLRGKCGLVTSERVGALYRERVERSLREGGLKPVVVEIPDGEEHKNLAWLAVLYEKLLDAGIERRSPLVGLGGGVVGDLTGFAGATLLRGLPGGPRPERRSSPGRCGDRRQDRRQPRAREEPHRGVPPAPLVVADVETLRTLPKR
jgi:3-dehydroquinate synthase